MTAIQLLVDLIAHVMLKFENRFYLRTKSISLNDDKMNKIFVLGPVFFLLIMTGGVAAASDGAPVESAMPTSRALEGPKRLQTTDAELAGYRCVLVQMPSGKKKKLLLRMNPTEPSKWVGLDVGAAQSAVADEETVDISESIEALRSECEKSHP